jgi:hypothetical protein
MNGQWDYYLFQGTSMAAPHVAGAAAVLMGMDVSADEAREILEVTAADIDEDGLDSNSGWGRLDLAAAVEELESRLDSPVVEEPDDEDEDIDEDDHDHDHDVDEPGDDSDFPIESRPDRHDEIAPSVTHIRARRCSHGIHINVQTDEMAGVMVCEVHSDNCAKSPPGTDHKLQLETDEAELELRTRDYAKNVRVMPLAL